MNNYKSKLFSCGLILLCVMLISPLDATTQPIETNQCNLMAANSSVDVSFEITDLTHTFNDTTEWQEPQTMNYTIVSNVDTDAETYSFEIEAYSIEYTFLDLDGEEFFYRITGEAPHVGPTFEDGIDGDIIDGNQTIHFICSLENMTEFRIEITFRIRYSYSDDDDSLESSGEVSTTVDIELNEPVIRPETESMSFFDIIIEYWWVPIVFIGGIGLIYFLFMAHVNIKNLKLDKKRLCDRHPNDPECQ